MYESITYEELKSLPRDQKVQALKELKALYPTQKKIAEKLGVNPANIYNMIAKYVKADDEGQPRADARAGAKAVRKSGVKAAGEAEAKTVREAEVKTVREAEAKAAGEAKAKAARAAEAEVNTELKLTGEAAKPVEAIVVPRTAVIGQEKTQSKRMREKKVKREENLMLTLSKSLTGEEAQALFAGIGSIFLKNHDYRLEIRISER